MNLRALVTPAKPAAAAAVAYDGQAGEIEVSSGQALRIETSPGGREVLNAVVPEGKRWIVYVKVNVKEFDA